MPYQGIVGRGRGRLGPTGRGAGQGGEDGRGPVEVGPHGQRLLGGRDRVRKEGQWALGAGTCIPEAQRGQPTPNLTDVETEPEREALPAATEPWGGTQRSPLLSAHSLRPACLCFSRQGVLAQVGSASGAPPTSAAGQRAQPARLARRRRPKEPSCAEQAPGHSPEQRKANTGNGRRLKVRSFSRVRLVRPGPPGGHRAQSVAARGASSPQSAAAPRGPAWSLPAHASLLPQPWPSPPGLPWEGPHCLYGKRRRTPSPSCWPGGHPACPQTPAAGRQRLRSSQDTGLGGTPVPKPCAGVTAPLPRCPQGHFRAQLFPAWQLGSLPREAGMWALGSSETPEDLTQPGCPQEARGGGASSGSPALHFLCTLPASPSFQGQESRGWHFAETRQGGVNGVVPRTRGTQWGEYALCPQGPG